MPGPGAENQEELLNVNLAKDNEHKVFFVEHDFTCISLRKRIRKVVQRCPKARCLD
jgi:hypothetical protein